jgi:hypothetical protein
MHQDEQMKLDQKVKLSEILVMCYFTISIP